MDIQDLGALGELIGSIAVLATLVYLAVQVRHAKRVASASAAQLRADASWRLWMAAVDPSALNAAGARLMEAAADGYDMEASHADNLRRALATLTRQEQALLNSWNIARYTHYRNVYYQIREGDLDERFEPSVPEIGLVFSLLTAFEGDHWRADEFYGYGMEKLALFETDRERRSRYAGGWSPIRPE